ncbi:Core-2/I-Branching enzyme [Musa troglodytarum]|uniref:Core-2/I-Branching enzyme n=1 Tax=Musa troglodytarum TaxID=320322 RepID=A0A9E7FJI6_9LILI|nr:Core-2/I-Branching enzyme [Musa troglodytarum]
MCLNLYLQGHEGRFSIYVHASREKPVHVSPLFDGRDIQSGKVVWGKISMVDAERRLLANALQDPDNQHFVLLSDSCVPLHNFVYVYNYLMGTNVSFIDCFWDPGPHGNARYTEHMLLEIEEKDFRKGSQRMRRWMNVRVEVQLGWWFSMKRRHALIVLADSLYYTKFKLYCKPGFDSRNCYADEHYLPTLLSMVDPTEIANWSVTHVDWSEGKWHPKAYRAQDITFELLKNITSIVENYHVTSDEKVNRLEVVFIYVDSVLVLVQLFLICFLYSCHNHQKHIRLGKRNLNLCKLIAKFYSFSVPPSYFSVFMRLG